MLTMPTLVMKHGGVGVTITEFSFVINTPKRRTTRRRKNSYTLSNESTKTATLKQTDIFIILAIWT